MADTNITENSTRRVMSHGLHLLTGFVQMQAKGVVEGGLPVLWRKVRTLVLAPLAFLVVVVVRALRPLLVIRFGPLVSYRIGHFSANTEVYLCELDAGLHGHRAIDIFYHIAPISNHQLKKMWDRSIQVSSLVSLPDRINRRLPGGDKHVIPWRKHQARDIHGLLASTKPHLAFTKEEEELGRAGLQQLGITNGEPYVCVLARDSAYLDEVQPWRTWEHQDFRDSSIQDYIPAAEELMRRGYYVIRMGAVVKEPLNSDNPMILDYATTSRTDFLDIYLSANCRFFISSGTGLDGVASLFRRPLLYVNYVPLDDIMSWNQYDMFIPKKLWLREEHRCMTFREILESDVGRFKAAEQYEDIGIEVLDLNPEDITAAAIEMDERLKGTWETTEEDEQLQQKFWSLYKPSELHKVIRTRIGAEFLRQYRSLLD